MKILYLDHVEADYLSAIVYMGLCQELSTDNVVDWPWKATFHGQNYEGPIPYDPPNNHGVTAPFPWMEPQAGRSWSDDEVCARIHEFDLVVLASPRAYNVAALARLIDRVGRAALRNLVLVDGEDYTTVRWDLVDQFRPSVVFKLSTVAEPYEVYHEQKARLSPTTKVVAFPLASPFVGIQPVEKTLDVAFLGGSNWRTVRQEGVPASPVAKAALESRLAREFSSFIGGTLPHAEYMATLNRAKVAICVGGSGIEPMRTYEILACPGTLLVRERISVLSPFPFIDGLNHAAFDGASHDDVVRVVRSYLEREPARARLAAAGNDFLRAHFTPRARARQLLKESV